MLKKLFSVLQKETKQYLYKDYNVMEHLKVFYGPSEQLKDCLSCTVIQSVWSQEKKRIKDIVMTVIG